MKTEELQELEKWKVGMEVIVSTNYTRSTDKITRITNGRGGTIYVDKSSYDIQGNGRGRNSWETNIIEPLTPELKEELVKSNRKNKLKNFEFHKLTPEQASEIVLKMREMGIKI